MLEALLEVRSIGKALGCVCYVREFELNSRLSKNPSVRFTTCQEGGSFMRIMMSDVTVFIAFVKLGARSALASRLIC